MKENILKAILIILLLGTFGMIFGFSSQNSDESGGISKQITKTLTKNIKSVQSLEKEQKEKVLEEIETVIRKTAHFSIYTIVGFLVMSLLSTSQLQNKYKIGLSILIGVLYASSDEIHQAFVPGRGCQATDVMIDTFGVLLGIWFAIGVKKLRKKNG